MTDTSPDRVPVNREGLGILVHPLSDHRRPQPQALWLGNPVPLKLDTLRRDYSPELLPAT